MKIIFSLSIFFITVFAGCRTKNQTSSIQISSPNHFISFTDLHFTPYADTSLVSSLVESEIELWDSIFKSSETEGYGTYGEETNYVLFSKALIHMKKKIEDPDFIIISGDFICHDFGAWYKKLTGNSNNDDMHIFLKKTMHFLVAKIESTYPKITIFPTLGNNDAYCGDYQIDMDGEYLEMFAELFYPLIDQEKKDSQIFEDLKIDGFYTASNPINPKHKIISFNSILFTPKYQSSKYERNCDCIEANQDSLVKVQFDWLEQQLEICSQKDDDVWLLTHVPPGVDIYSTSKKDKVVTYWDEKYAETFKNIINKYYATVKVTMAGHTHMDDFKIIFNNENPESYIHISPSVSPVFGNNPAYQVVYYDTSDATFYNYNSFNVELAEGIDAKWKTAYDYNATYGFTNFTPAGMNLLYQKLVSDSTLRQHYFDFYPSGSKAGSFITPENWGAYKCGNINILDQNYSECVNP